MGKISVFNSITLDGVMQSPGRPDEDTRGGFTHGGWAQPHAESVFAVVGKSTTSSSGSSALLLGRRTYEDFASVWPHMPTENPYTNVINNQRKFVASRTLEEPLEWNNSTLLKGDAAETVAHLKDEFGSDLTILGSGDLIQTLLRHKLIDHFTLLIHPIVLGSGRRLFTDQSALTNFTLTNTQTSDSGVIIANYDLM